MADRAVGIKLSSRHLTWFYAAFSVLYFSGIAWIYFHYFVSGRGSLHPGESLSLNIHGGAAMASLILLGTMIPVHMKRGWNAQKNRGQGIFLITVCLLLILTGYVFYYLGNENLNTVAHRAHLVLGTLFPFFLTWHILKGRKSMRPASSGSDRS